MSTIAATTSPEPPDPSSSGVRPSLRAALERIVPAERILDRPIERIAFASDASFYRLIPKAVVLARSVEEIAGIFRLARETRVPVTFRASGTSLSGQAVGDGVLVEVARHWRTVTVEDGGARFRTQPGVIGASVNATLRAYRARMGPDPASVSVCTMGGILSNNSSGMCCGVSQNAYHTLESLTFLLPSGTLIDTALPDADERLRAMEPRLWHGIAALRDRIHKDPALVARIRSKYLTKNTTGYSINAFVDFERPVDIFRNVLVGAEGTLAFVAEAVLSTVPDLPVRYTGLLLFSDLYAACAAIVPLRDSGARALELLDRASLRSVERQPGIPGSIRELPEGAAALLAEYQGEDDAARGGLEAAAAGAVRGLSLLSPGRFTHDPVEQALLWRVRQGTFPSVGAARRSGTTVLIEDVAFPVERLADAALDLNRLFARHGYADGIIFGHAKEGNLHFVVSQSFNDQAAIDRYARFMDDVVDLVVRRYDGALKAEHGTGRNMAPFVEAEWGAEAWGVMKRLKELADPDGILNPGVIVNPDPLAHLRDLKPMPTVEEEVDKCIECGYCEPKCPSRELTLTPRQRIVLRREMTRLEAGGVDAPLLASLRADFPHDALDTCAVDGLCATACPVSIDTGRLTKRLREAGHGPRARKVALAIARRFASIEPVLRAALTAGHIVQSILGESAMVGITGLLRAVAGGEVPLWSRDMPRAARASRPETSSSGAAAVYFPSCISRTMGAPPGESAPMSLVEAFVAVAARAGRPVFVPEDVEGTCCGVPFSSKGYAEAHAFAANRAIERFFRWSDGGRLPVVVDTSPCTLGLTTCRSVLTPGNQARFDTLTILDGVAFAHDTLLPGLGAARRAGRVAIHPVCSVTRMNLGGKLEAIARFCSDDVLIPASSGCCGFAGDLGFLVPDLTASATRHEADEVKAGGCAEHISSSRTCEIGMTRATGEVYRSYVFLLEKVTRA